MDCGLKQYEDRVLQDLGIDDSYFLRGTHRPGQQELSGHDISKVLRH